MDKSDFKAADDYGLVHRYERDVPEEKYKLICTIKRRHPWPETEYELTVIQYGYDKELEYNGWSTVVTHVTETKTEDEAYEKMFDFIGLLTE